MVHCPGRYARWLNGTRAQPYEELTYLCTLYEGQQQQQHRQLQHPNNCTNRNETPVRQRVIYILLNAIARRTRAHELTFGRVVGETIRFRENVLCEIRVSETPVLFNKHEQANFVVESIKFIHRMKQYRIATSAPLFLEMHFTRSRNEDAWQKQKPYTMNSKRSKALVNTSVDALSVMFDVLGIYTMHFNR